TSPANDATDTPVKAAKRTVSMAAEKAPAKAAVKVSKTATKTAAKKAAKPASGEKTTKAARGKKAEDKLADLMGGGARPSSGRRPGRPAKNANNDNDNFDDSMD